MSIHGGAHNYLVFCLPWITPLARKYRAWFPVVGEEHDKEKLVVNSIFPDVNDKPLKVLLLL